MVSEITEPTSAGRSSGTEPIWLKRDAIWFSRRMSFCISRTIESLSSGTSPRPPLISSSHPASGGKRRAELMRRLLCHADPYRALLAAADVAKTDVADQAENRQYCQ